MNAPRARHPLLIYAPPASPPLPPRLHPLYERNDIALASCLPVAYTDMAQFIPLLFAQSRYSGDYMQEEIGTATATRQRHHRGYAPGGNEYRLLLRWRPKEEQSTILAWRAEVIKGRFAGDDAPYEAKEIGNQLGFVLYHWLVARRNRRTFKDPVLGPGGSLDAPFEGQLRDYSRCARLKELCDPELDEAHDLSRGIIPLGRYVELEPLSCGWPATIIPGPMLSIGPEALFKGTLICAPPGAGKTELVLRWASAAIDAGLSVLIVDVKGSIYPKLQQQRESLPANLYRFSTLPSVINSDQINFLQGLDGRTPEGRDAFERLAKAILPDKDFKGDESVFHGNRLEWLTGVIGLVTLHEEYFQHTSRLYPGQPREHDMGDVYELLSSERRLCDLLVYLAWCEHSAKGNIIEPGLEYWYNRVAILVGQQQLMASWRQARAKYPELLEEPPISGGRRAMDTYEGLTQNLRTALALFDPKRGIYSRISGDTEGTGRRFSFEDLAQPKQVVIILEVPAKGGLNSDTLLSMAIARLEGFLDERFAEAADRGRLQPVLLLLDETRRMRGFDPERFISFEREAQAGLVVVYQNLTQIGEGSEGKHEVDKLLGVVGTQIYLRELRGKNYEYFKAQFPEVTRQTYYVDSTPAPGGVVRNRRVQQEKVPFLENIALAELPGGPYSALVYLRGHPADKPFLVDMENKHFAAAAAEGQFLRAPVPASALQETIQVLSRADEIAKGVKNA